MTGGGRTALEAVGDGHKPIRHQLVLAKGETAFDRHGIRVGIVRPGEQRLVKTAPIVSGKAYFVFGFGQTLPRSMLIGEDALEAKKTGPAPRGGSVSAGKRRGSKDLV
jgi:hypothetical protein